VEETAAIVAAIGQFRRDTAPAPAADQRIGGQVLPPWKRAALDEGVARAPDLQAL